ncbi:hypothetical protein ACT6DC_06830 [Campylobacter coli]|uniref:hypothetical protein n=2 Tax=Campylobacter coli TaxID=195 RepID=UPI004034445A
MKTLSNIIILSALLINFSFANDLLAKLSNGAVSDNSQGVKALSLDEMKQVKGGYQTSFKLVGNNELLAFAKPSWTSELTLFQDSNGDQYYWNREGLVRFGGMCGIDTTNCLVNGKHTYTNQQRLWETMSIVGDDPYRNFLGYTVKRNIGISNLGKRFVYFSYGVAVINEQSGSWYRVKSSPVLNNYRVVKEISSNYKDFLERYLGGYSIK